MKTFILRRLNFKNKNCLVEKLRLHFLKVLLVGLLLVYFTHESFSGFVTGLSKQTLASRIYSFRLDLHRKAESLSAGLRTSCRNAQGVDVKQPKGCSAMGITQHVPVHIFIHVLNVPGFEPILLDIMFSLLKSNLLELAVSTHVCVLGRNIDEISTALVGFQNEISSGRILIEHVGTNPELFELPTLNRILKFAQKTISEGFYGHILYMHSKGLYAASGAYVFKWYWRKTMQHWLIDNHIHCRKMLDFGYDTVGSNPLNGHESSIFKGFGKGSVNGSSVHYSGNFWWATAHHLARLPGEIEVYDNMEARKRLMAENLILSTFPNMCAGVVYHWDSLHMYEASDVPNISRLLETAASCYII